MGTANRYLDFLCKMVGRYREYFLLLEHLHRIEFYSLIPYDENRAYDGEELWELYIRCSEPPVPRRPCTVLEMLIGLSKRLEYCLLDTPWERDLGGWFWILIDNLDLLGFHNEGYNEHVVDFRVINFLDRRYSRNGDGGLFPLSKFKGDVRDIEIWKQMNIWLSENYPV